MEARSLTALNNLAGNPPQYPINPAQERQDPLTLYISRVPGTRDVILSPFKPQLKIVTAEDIANCLYYVHLEAPSSELAFPPPLRGDGHRSSSDESSSIRNIPRKPLPGSARPLTPPSREHLPVPAFGNEYQELSRRRGLSVNSSLDASRAPPAWPGYEPASNDQNPVLPPRPTPVIQAPISRKPMGPRPLSSPANGTDGDKPLPPAPGPFQTVTDFDGVTTSQPPPLMRNAASRSPSPRKSIDGQFKQPFTLALIRRDPSTGNQWNVGHISSFQSDAPQIEQDENPLFTPVPPVAQPPGTGSPPINVQIETLGYGKFRGMPARRSFDAGPGAADMNQPPRDGGVVLQRQVAMGYTKSWASNWREKLNRVEQDGFGRGHGRQGSVGSVESTGSAESPTEPHISMQPGPGLRPRGYIFTSPWNGRCEFRTGSAGRSLRCYHILHEERPFNPLMDQATPIQMQGGAMPVSELRFNLPTAELFKSPEGREEVKNQLQGHFNKLLRRDGRTSPSDDDDGMVSPFDLNLGREKAGGGNRGKRAKLGKLIIYPDGLKMIDLVVAANMGLWWQAWEKSF
ncbi:hypothetical protein ACJ41O_014874 [Fusarium nematophilum]